MMKIILLLVCLIGFTSVDTLHAPIVKMVNSAPSSAPAFPKADSQMKIDPGLAQFILPAMVLLFGMVVVIFPMVQYSNNKDFTSEHAIRIVSITLMTTGVLFIISTGNLASSQNVTPLYAPAFGLLGTMAGYLLGRGFKPEPSEKEKEKEK